MNAGLMITLAGLLVGAASSLLGIWLERDPSRPRRNGYLLTMMIVLSCGVGMAQASLNRKGNEQMATNLARILDDLDTLAKDDPALQRYLDQEVRTQAVANPEVIRQVVHRAEARGEKPSEVLASRGMPTADIVGLGLPAPATVRPVVKPVTPEAGSEAPVPASDAPSATKTSGPGLTPGINPTLGGPKITVDGKPVQDVKIGDIATKAVKLDDVKLDGVAISDVKVGAVKLEDIKPSDLEVGDLAGTDLDKLEALKKLELQKIEALKKAQAGKLPAVLPIPTKPAPATPPATSPPK